MTNRVNHIFKILLRKTRYRHLIEHRAFVCLKQGMCEPLPFPFLRLPMNSVREENKGCCSWFSLIDSLAELYWWNFKWVTTENENQAVSQYVRGFGSTGDPGRDQNKFLTSFITLINKKMCWEGELLDFFQLREQNSESPSRRSLVQ